MDLSELIGGGLDAYKSYNEQKTAAKNAETAQQNAQAAMNNANSISILSENKTKLALIAGAVVILVAFFMFGRRR